MSHFEQLEFLAEVKNIFPDYFEKKKVLEIGSLNINGTVRDFFDNCNFIGLDLDEGHGVDIVCLGHHYDAPDNTFDVVISCECFEHNPFWIPTFYNMHRMTSQNGLVILTCATIGRPEHGTTKTTPQDSPFTVEKGWDYYKNLSVKDFTNAFDLHKMFKSFSFRINHASKDLYFWGIKE
jgi:hypothetical protein